MNNELRKEAEPSSHKLDSKGQTLNNYKKDSNMGSIVEKQMKNKLIKTILSCKTPDQLICCGNILAFPSIKNLNQNEFFLHLMNKRALELIKDNKHQQKEA